MEVITSHKNEAVRRMRALSRAKGRRESGLVLIEGPNLFGAALEAGASFDTILVTPDDSATHAAARQLDLNVLTVTEEVLTAAADTPHPQSPIASIVRPSRVEEIAGLSVVVLVGVSDPGNAGTIIRTAASFGWAVAATPETVDLWAPKTVRSGAGAHFATPVVEGTDLETIGHSRTVVATVPTGGEPNVKGHKPYALLIGSEAHGLTRDVVESADELLTIGMSDAVESLNASVAAGIALYVLEAQD
jgi:TrmH family RNA methyltransferase